MSTVVWFRSDLRADDNSALAEAARDGGRVAGLFLLTPAQWGAHDWGARKQLFVWRHVLALRERLAALALNRGNVQAELGQAKITGSL